MVKTCIAGGCSNNYRKGTTLFKFPSDPKIRLKWIKEIRKTRSDWKEPTANSFVCIDHFSEDCLLPYSRMSGAVGVSVRKLLKPDAVPTIFKKSCDKPSQKRKSKAFEKRERARVLATAGSSTRQLNFTQDDDDTISDMECDSQEFMSSATPKFISSATQCDPVHQRHVKVQVKLKKSASNKASQTCSFKPLTHDVAVQCDLLEENPIETSMSTPRMTSTPIKCSDCGTDSSGSIDSVNTNSTEGFSDCQADSFVSQDPISENKYIVFESCLMSLFSTCSYCMGNTTVDLKTIGSMLRVSKYCIACDETTIWESQPWCNRTPAGNILLSACILMSGSLSAKVLRLFQFMNCLCISSRTFYQHQTKLLHPSIESYWRQQQMSMFGVLQSEEKQLVLGGDGRCDSPGFCAKFGSYTFMELEHNVILHIELVQSNEVKSSTAMEMEGFVRGWKVFEENGLGIELLVTDRHRQLSKFVRENLPEIYHCYDVWHVAKSFRKKLDKLAKQKGCELVSEWAKSMVNHLYWSAMSSEGSCSQLIREKWLSLINHIHNRHSGHGELYKECSHGYLRRKWFKDGTPASEKVKAIIEDKLLLKDIEKLSTNFQTSQLESFHSLLNHYAPKQVAFSYQGMLSRLYLSALHYSFNNTRKQATTKSGNKRYKVLFPKYKKGGHIVREVKLNPSFKFAEDILRDVFELLTNETHDITDITDRTIPPPLSSQFEAPEKEEAIKTHTSRFNK